MGLGGFALAVGLMGASGCRNACQDLCVELHDYATECGLPVTDDELKSCIDQEKGKESKDDRKVCNEFGDPETLRLEWSCDDMGSYWGTSGGADSGA
jgi:hypothetical protein